MCFIFSLIPATICVVIGYFVLFASTRAEGGMQRFGQALAIWIFILALMFPVVGIYVTIAWQCPMERVMQNLATTTDRD